MVSVLERFHCILLLLHHLCTVNSVYKSISICLIVSILATLHTEYRMHTYIVLSYLFNRPRIVDAIAYHITYSGKGKGDGGGGWISLHPLQSMQRYRKSIDLLLYSQRESLLSIPNLQWG